VLAAPTFFFELPNIGFAFLRHSQQRVGRAWIIDVFRKAAGLLDARAHFLNKLGRFHASLTRLAEWRSLLRFIIP